jgi:hypothetical protein
MSRFSGCIDIVLNGIVDVWILSGLLILCGFEKDKLQLFVMWQYTFSSILAS